jgi:hypothetical protein
VIGDTPADVECGKASARGRSRSPPGWHSVDELRGSEPWMVLERIPDPAGFRRLIGIEEP